MSTLSVRNQSVRPVCVEARSSVGEHFLDAEGVGGSIPPVPMQRPEG